jgi:Tfp pilus assembly protein PilN
MVVKINLLPPEVLRQRRIKWTKTIIIVVLIILVGICSIRWVILKIGYADIKKDIRKEEMLIAELRPKVAELRRIEAEIQEMRKRIDVIDELQKGRLMWVKFLDEFCNTIPHGVWISQLTPEQKGLEYDLSVTATALDNFSIANFMVNLMQTPKFYQVKLINITTSEMEGREVKNFNLTWRFSP